MKNPFSFPGPGMGIYGGDHSLKFLETGSETTGQTIGKKVIDLAGAGGEEGKIQWLFDESGKKTRDSIHSLYKHGGGGSLMEVLQQIGGDRLAGGGGGGGGDALISAVMAIAGAMNNVGDIGSASGIEGAVDRLDYVDGDLMKLVTGCKDNLVGAINELAYK